ncbi:MAG: MiaB/RimO family radical SAM methylthiotransferase [Deltaproteobacteria bacterium]|nr:MiaB/RimO family radical SAM methylthiotransferase [Deltaproteobacteria bacterium]
MFRYSIRTLGCKANLYDSLVLERELSELGGERDDKNPDLFLLNSCTVTQSADSQCLYEVRALKKRSPEAWTVVTGCYAEVAEEKIRASLGVDAVINNRGKRGLKKMVADRFGIALVNDPSAAESDLGAGIYWGQLPVFKGRVRAFLKIQEGCNDFCTYCIIPYARGKSRSVRPGPLIAEAQRLADAGVRELVLTGVNIADYGLDHGSDPRTSFDDLVEALLERTTMPRIRLSSLDPSEISDRLLSMMTAGGRLMPHFHVSLQSAVSRVLRAMKRAYRAEDVEAALERIHARSSGIFVGMDVIAGFASETDEEHREGLRRLERLPWTRLHVFPYSERGGTPAARIPGAVEPRARFERARELLELSRVRHEAFVKRYVGKRVDGVLFESAFEAGGDHFVAGHSPNYLRVMARMPSRTEEEARSRSNTIASVRALGALPKPEQDWTLEAAIENAVFDAGEAGHA